MITQQVKEEKNMNRITSLPRMRATLLVAAAVCVLVALGVLARSGIVGATGETAVVFVPEGDVRAGELITVRIEARNVSDLAGFQGTVRYNQADLRLTGATVGQELGRSGRGILPLGPVMGDGSVALGAATCPVVDCAGLLNGTERVERGLNGRVQLGVLEFYSNAAGSYTLTLDGVQLVDPQGTKLAVSTAPFVLEVRPADAQ